MAEGWGCSFLKKSPGLFWFVILSLEILEERSFHPWKFCKILWHALEISRPKTKTYVNSTSFSWTLLETPLFLIRSWNFHMLFLQYRRKWSGIIIARQWKRDRFSIRKIRSNLKVFYYVHHHQQENRMGQIKFSHNFERMTI